MNRHLRVVGWMLAVALLSVFPSTVSAGNPCCNNQCCNNRGCGVLGLLHTVNQDMKQALRGLHPRNLGLCFKSQCGCCHQSCCSPNRCNQPCNISRPTCGSSSSVKPACDSCGCSGYISDDYYQAPNLEEYLPPADPTPASETLPALPQTTEEPSILQSEPTEPITFPTQDDSLRLVPSDVTEEPFQPTPSAPFGGDEPEESPFRLQSHRRNSVESETIPSPSDRPAPATNGWRARAVSSPTVSTPAVSSPTVSTPAVSTPTVGTPTAKPRPKAIQFFVPPVN